jgi:flagellum-specific peptidoglycan hydrolase FlgJ
MVAAEQAISAIYSVKKPETTWAADFRVAQALLETGNFRWGHDSRRWNLAGVKKGGNVGDEPVDFEIPPTPEAGGHMQANHGRAYALNPAVKPVHARYADAFAAQKARGYPVIKIGQLGKGIWATDPDYAVKIKAILGEMEQLGGIMG